MLLILKWPAIDEQMEFIIEAGQDSVDISPISLKKIPQNGNFVVADSGKL